MKGRYIVALAGGAVCLLGLAFALVDYVTHGRFSVVGASISAIGFVCIVAGVIEDIYQAAFSVVRAAAKTYDDSVARQQWKDEPSPEELREVQRAADEMRQERRQQEEKASRLLAEKRATELLQPITPREVSRNFQNEQTTSGCLFVAGGLTVIACWIAAAVAVLGGNDSQQAMPLAVYVGVSGFISAAVLFGLGSIVDLLAQACAVLRRLDERDAEKMRRGRGDRTS